MKITSASTSLLGVLDYLESIIKPELKTNIAKSYLQNIEAILTDLWRREGPQIKLLQDILVEGESLRNDILRTLRPATATSEPIAHPGSFEELARLHETLTSELFELCEHLAREQADHPKAPGLLRQAAEWEISYYEGIHKVSAQNPITSGNQEALPPLTEEYLRNFLVGKREVKSVADFYRMSGGHGKQTYECTVTYENNKTERMVIRKEDAVPIIDTGLFKCVQEFALLRSLNKTDFPTPQVYESSGPAPEGVDGGFFIMAHVPGAILTTFLGSTEAELSEDLLLQLAAHQAKLHSFPLETFTDYIEEYEDTALLHQTVTERYRTVLERWWAHYTSIPHLPSTYLVWLFEWLTKNLPQSNQTPVLTHGDFNFHNVLVQDGKITAVLDWETADFGLPEQDLAYLQPQVSKQMSWEKFIAHYRKCGGPELNPTHFAFCQAYSVLRTSLAFNRATMNIQKRWSPDIRFNMVELGYEAVFMRMGLSYTEMQNQKSPGDSAESNPPANGTQNGHSSAPGDEAHDTKNGLEKRVVGEKGEQKDLPSTDLEKTSSTFPDHASGGQKLLIFGDEANKRQQPGPDANWQESFVLVWWDDQNQIGGFHRLGHEPNLPDGGRATLWTQLITPEGVSKRTKYNLLRDTDFISGGGMGSGDDIATHKFENGKHKWTIIDEEHGVEASISHHDIGPNLSGFPQKGATKTGLASHHFDVPGVVTGKLVVKGKVYQINGHSIRDHAWGRRDWNRSILSHRWVVGTGGPDLSFVGVTYHSVDDKLAKFGWVVRRGVVTYAKEIDILAYMEPDSCVNRGGRVRYVLDDGEELVFDHIPVEAKAAVSYHHGIPCVDRICKFRCSNGLTGFSNFESSSNIQAGERRPGLLVDGIMEDGFWPGT